MKKDTLKQREILEKWEQSKPEDPDLFTSYFNYFYSLSRQEFIVLTQEELQGESLIFTDSLCQTAGYLGSRIVFDKKLFRKGMEKIDEGIALHPDRLDMRFGKIYVLGITEDWQGFTNEIIETVRYSKINGNQWIWKDNEILPDGKETLFSSLQEYQLTLYNTEDDRLLPYMREIASEMLEIYPEHVESMSNIAITYLLTEDYDKAIEVLLRAEKVDPRDTVVLNNIAYGYEMRGNLKNAIGYYEKVIKYGDAGEVEAAKERIRKLKQ